MVGTDTKMNELGMKTVKRISWNAYSSPLKGLGMNGETKTKMMSEVSGSL